MPLFEQIKWGIKYTGCVISFMNLIGQIVYGMKSIFLTRSQYDSYQTFLVLRLIIIAIMGLYFFVRRFL